MIVWLDRARDDFRDLLVDVGGSDLNVASRLGRAVDEVLWTIETSPAVWPVVDPEFGVRRAVLPGRFRKLLLYYVLVPYPVIVGLVNGRRHPELIAQMLRGRVR